MSKSNPDNHGEDTVSVVSKSLWVLLGGFVAVGIVMFAVLLLVLWSFV